MHIPVASANLLEQFARTLITSLDGNRDEQLSTNEFTSFLAGLADTGTDVTTSRARQEGRGPDMPGFDATRLGDPSHTTTKYIFGRVAQRYSLASVQDMSSAESLLSQMRADLEAAGITVLDVSRDKIQIRDEKGQAAWIDVIRGAGAADPAFQWLDTRFGHS